MSLYGHNLYKINYTRFVNSFFIVLLAYGSPNISATTKAPFLSYGQSLKTFFKKILGIFKLLFTTSRVSSKKF